MRFVVVVACVLAGCAQSGSNNGGNPDLAGGNSICPAHPGNCSGKCCGTQCTEIMVDVNNCGDCGNKCKTGQVCSGGSCGCPPSGATCGQGQSCCGVNGCKSLGSDDFNCGNCGVVCMGGSHCSGGNCLCGGTQCGTGQTCCNGACASACATPDMATATPDMAAGGLCQCASMCPLSKTCVGPNCCFEDAFVGSCTPSMTCMPQQYP